jgi:hypothetical protein
VKCEGPEPAWGHPWMFLGDVRHAFSSVWNKEPEDETPYKDPMTRDARRESFEELDTKTQYRHLLPQPVDVEKPPAFPSVWNKEPEEETLYKDLLPRDSRFESFKELDSTKTQYRLFMPQPVDTEKLPTVPIGWGEQEQHAVRVTILHTRLPEVAQSKFGVDLESDDPDDYAKVSSPDPMEEYEVFVKVLPLCVPMTIGFHAKDGERKSCYCPCSKGMDKWRKFCWVNLTDESACKLTRAGKACCEFLQHPHDVGTPPPPYLGEDQDSLHYISIFEISVRELLRTWSHATSKVPLRYPAP